MRMQPTPQQNYSAKPVRLAHLAHMVFASSLLLAAASCAKKTMAAPEGWLLNGQPLTSAQNNVLSAGSILHLPEGFTIEAAADTVVRVTEPKPKEFHVNLLYGTAMLSRHDAATVVSVEAGMKFLPAQGARFLLQRKTGNTKLLVFDATVEISDGSANRQISAKAENYAQLSAGKIKIAALAQRDLLRQFPELTNSRRLIAAR